MVISRKLVHILQNLCTKNGGWIYLITLYETQNRQYVTNMRQNQACKTKVQNVIKAAVTIRHQDHKISPVHSQITLHVNVKFSSIFQTFCSSCPPRGGRREFRLQTSVITGLFLTSYNSWKCYVHKGNFMTVDQLRHVHNTRLAPELKLNITLVHNFPDKKHP